MEEKRPPLVDMEVVMPPSSNSWSKIDSIPEMSNSSSNTSLIETEHPTVTSAQNRMSHAKELWHKWKPKKQSPISFLQSWLPISSWLPNYKLVWLKGDVIAGLTTAVMAIPQSMAYATVAGVPPVYGLYAACIPPLVYALFGTSPQLAVAPVAVQCIILRSVLSFVDNVSEPDRYLHLAILTSLITGIFTFVCGILRLGYVVTFFSPSVIKSFNAASGLVILVSQLDSLLGYSTKRSEFAIIQLVNVISSIHKTSWQAVLIGTCGMAILVLMQKKCPPWIPSALIVTVLGALAAFLLDTYARVLVPVVGMVPAGLPIPRVRAVYWEDVTAVLPGAIVMGLVGYMSAFAVTEKYAEVYQYTIDPNQELVAFGLTHVIGWFFQGIDAFGGLSRTVVNVQAGAHTQVAGIITGLTILLALQFLTTFLFYIPKSILAAVIISAVYQLLDPRPFIQLYRMKKQDFAVALVTSALTIFTTVQYGLFIGIGFSLFMIVYRSAHPHWTILGELSYKPGTFKSVRRYRGARQYGGILIFRFDASLFFANIQYFQKTLIKQIDKRGHMEVDSDAEDTVQYAEFQRSRADVEAHFDEHRSVPEPVQFVVLDFNPVNDMDVSASHGIMTLQRRLWEQHSILVFYAGVKGPVRDTLWRVTGGVQGAERYQADLVHYLPSEAIRATEAIRRFSGSAAFPQQPTDPDNPSHSIEPQESQLVETPSSDAHTPPISSQQGITTSLEQTYVACVLKNQLHADQFFLTVHGAVSFALAQRTSSQRAAQT
ncbi:sulfate transporter family-domain-containing protein [Cladochytrium replicatum]|nr:sulfate transporter family-domain-containing protein [Cladochytrium replicatum]